MVRPGGTVNLGADLGSLTVIPGSGFRPQAFTLIDNQGSQLVSGNWTDLPEGSVIPVNGIDFTLTYQGGDGNDVVLTPGGPNATVSADGKTATYTDVDGDRVTIKSSKGGLTTDRIVLSKANALGGSSLLLLDATAPAFAGTSLTITAKPVPHAGVAGDGLANVRIIDAGANALGSVAVGGDLGEIDAGAVKNLSVATFGLFDQSQPVSTLASLGSLAVKGSVDTARLIITGALGSAKIGGSVNRAILFDIGTTVGAFSVRGGFAGAELTIGGTDNPTAKQALVLKSLTIGGDVTGSTFRIGHDHTTSIGSDPNRKNADVQVGKVVVKGNWTGSSFYVGTDAGPDNRFGTADDIVIPGGNGTVAKINSFTIGGLAAGDAGLRSFGIVAEQIGALKIGKAKAALSKTAPDALPLLVTGDFFVREIGAADPVLAPLPNANANVGPAAIELPALTGLNGFQINGEAAGDNSGRSVSAAGDVNGDGFDDLLIGAYSADPNGSESGASYMVFGQAGGFGANLNLSTLDGSNGFQIHGETAGDTSGFSVSAAGDVNGDGFDDLLIGAHKASQNGTSSGASYVVFGKAGGFAANLELSTLDGANGFQINGEAAGDFAGYSVSGAGDVNGDGFDDLLIGASVADPNGTASGASYVVFGKAVGFAANLELSTLNGSNGFQINGEAINDFSGTSVSAAGDVNGDGFDDILIGADGAAPNGSYSGASYVVFGFGTGVATVSADGKTATWLDVDGDLVTLKSSKGGLTAERLHLSTPNALGGSRLVSADFTDAAFAGSNITITAKTQKGLPTAADGLVVVGSIFAGANALGTVSIAGDLAQLDAGAVKALTVNSLGLFPVATKGAPGTSDIASLGALTVKTSWQSVDLTVTGALGKATIGGNVRDATLAATTVGPVKIGGDLSNAKFHIAGVANPTAKTALALKSLTVGGGVKTSSILLGYDATGAPVNAQVQAGKIAIKDNFIASNLVAGTTAGTDDIFGTADDAVIAGASAIISKIASITIGGSAFGTSAADDHFGIVAQQIAALKVGKAKAALSKTGTDVLEFLITGDFTARELA